MTTSVPIVEYLVLDDRPHLAAQKCTNCGAHFFDRRDACASCFGTEFTTAEVGSSGTLETFTIVAVAAPGVEVPFVAGVVDCEGISVRANIVNVEPTVDAVQLGMQLRLTTFPIGVDDNGVTAVGFGFEPDSNGKDN
ncbi:MULTISPECIES: Zn-ribbon domain-containing OB-fold protein [unclassified Mycobacterium]|uniref:Zn-ribbon domain-containing OB-fold protein n=1 Tax=unclassified Mycobacterium TaxID=2642494 RepID=UPI0029C66208|nr:MULTISPECIES: OB-fold domain-containing protein [unclassified Mycobacterium]